ncbi:MAG: hypothetical protein WDN24_09445 [Sphingomonas sp.]
MRQRSWRRSSPYLTLALLAAISTCGFIDRILMNVLAQPIKLEFRLSDFEVGWSRGSPSRCSTRCSASGWRVGPSAGTGCGWSR